MHFDFLNKHMWLWSHLPQSQWRESEAALLFVPDKFDLQSVSVICDNILLLIAFNVLYNAILRSRADSLRLHVILHE